MDDLAAANGDDDFHLIGIRQTDQSVLAARHDFAIEFNGDSFAGKIQFKKKFGNAQRRRKLTLLAVDAEGDHFVAPAKSSRILGREFTTRV
jgi:glycine cleavage system aminomethyltransferase T